MAEDEGMKGEMEEKSTSKSNVLPISNLGFIGFLIFAPF